MQHFVSTSVLNLNQISTLMLGIYSLIQRLMMSQVSHSTEFL